MARYCRAGVTFAADLDRGVAAAKAAAADKYVNVLGASIARQCLAAGLLDEILVCIAPVLLGDGVRLFDDPGGSSVRLECLSLSLSQALKPPTSGYAYSGYPRESAASNY